MKPTYYSKLINSINADIIQTGTRQQFDSISIDSRNIQKGDLFWAIKGEKFDGNKFAREVAFKGASGVVVSDSSETKVQDGCWILNVSDTLKAFQIWAQIYRKQFTCPIIGITGTVGKTTVKTMISSLLAHEMEIVHTAGNLNGQIGVPLTLFNLKDSTQIGVVEMGISIPGEMNRLVQMVHPETAVLTYISPVHMEFFKNMEQLLTEKTNIFGAKNNLKYAVINCDTIWIDKVKNRVPVKPILYGSSKSADYRIERFEDNGIKGSRFIAVTPSGNMEIALPFSGKHNAVNSLAAIACMQLYQLTDEQIISGLAKTQPVSMRMEFREINGITFINDAYNASPEAMKVALESLSNITGKRHIAILGDMLELGDYEIQAHENLATDVMKNSVDILVTVGELSTNTADSVIKLGFPREKVISVADAESAAELLPFLVEKGDIILLKGSRRLKLEQIEKKFMDS